mgnify:CR=1 FL=1
MSVLLIAEHNNKELRPFTLNAATAASKIDGDVHVLVLGSKSDSVAKAASEISVVKKVIHVDNEVFENFTAENYTSSIVKHADAYSHIICSANTFGKNLMPRIAALLDVSHEIDTTRRVIHQRAGNSCCSGNRYGRRAHHCVVQFAHR